MLVIAAVVLAGCGGGGGTGTAPPPTAPSAHVLTLSPYFSTPPPSGVGVGSIDFQFTVAGAAASFEALESGYTGAFTVSGCSGVATVSPASATGPIGLFTITAVAAGTCAFTVKDTGSHSAFVSVTVTTTSGGIL